MKLIISDDAPLGAIASRSRPTLPLSFVPQEHPPHGEGSAFAKKKKKHVTGGTRHNCILSFFYASVNNVLTAILIFG